MIRLRQDLGYALRTFARTPGFAAVSILVVAVGIGANTAIFTIVNQLLLKIDPVILTVATIVLTTAATVAGVVPARRATRVQPLSVLQSE